LDGAKGQRKARDRGRGLRRKVKCGSCRRPQGLAAAASPLACSVIDPIPRNNSDGQSPWADPSRRRFRITCSARRQTAPSWRSLRTHVAAWSTLPGRLS